REKTLRKVFRVRRRDALSPNEAINGSPISATKLFERFLSRRRLALRLQHHAPVGGGKRDRALFRAWGDTTPRGLIINRHVAIETKSHAKRKPAGHPLIPGVVLILTAWFGRISQSFERSPNIHHPQFHRLRSSLTKK